MSCNGLVGYGLVWYVTKDLAPPEDLHGGRGVLTQTAARQLGERFIHQLGAGHAMCQG